MQIAISILSILAGLYLVYFIVIALFGAFRKPRINPYSPPSKKLAVLVAARNESEVIGELVESLAGQNYPDELYDIIVIPNNCTDDTRGAAEAAGAEILDCTVETHSKGEVLTFAFKRLLARKYRYDAFVIFDADNVADPGFLQSVNNALCAGVKIAQGYRDSKNADESWTAGCTSMFYWGMNRLYNRARDSLNMSAALNGTGFMVSAEVLKELDGNFRTLTEDLELSAKAALAGYRIGWMQDAITYDEQPKNMKDSFKQRRRWSAGTFQCLRYYGWDLLKQSVRRRSNQCFDMFIVFTGAVMQLFCMIPAILIITRYITRIFTDPAQLTEFTIFCVTSLVTAMATMFLVSTLICFLEKKMNFKRLLAVLLFPIYMLTWMAANLMCLFTRPPKWTEIRHYKAKVSPIAGRSGPPTAPSA